MATLTSLPPEILSQIISEISPDQQGTLANLSLSCRAVYLQVIPVLYRTFRLRFFGRASWPSQTDILKRLVPPGSYDPSLCSRVYSSGHDGAGNDSVDDDDAGRDGGAGGGKEGAASAGDRKGKGVPGRPSLPARPNCSARAGGSGLVDKKADHRLLPLSCIREVVICGFWNHPKEEHSDEYFLPNDGDVREHTPFVDALQGLLWSLSGLESFSWLITRPLPPRITAAVARFGSLNSIAVFGDTHIYAPPESFRYHSHNPAAICNSPIAFSNNRLVSIKALQTGDYQQVIDYGDVMRNGSNWESIRTLEFDISPGFIGMLVEMEPMEPDILAALFRPPPPPRGCTSVPRMQLHRLRLRDVAFLQKGIEAITKAIDPGELRDLDFYYCQEGTALLRRWEDNRLKKLERVHIKEELALPYLCRFLKQFGPSGACRNLRTLELCCWHADRWNMFDPLHNPNVSMVLADYDSENDSAWDADDDGVFAAADDSDLEDVYASEGHPIVVPPPSPPAHRARLQLPQPFRSIKDLRGNRDEGWGLERLVLDMRPGVSALTTRLLPQQEIFFEGFWRIRELAIPASYDTDCWNQFVETIAKLPNLQFLFLLNARTESRSGSNYVNFSIYQQPFMPPPPPPVAHVYPPVPSRPGVKRRGAKAREPEPDKQYVDALKIAARNRLHVHSGGMPRPARPFSSPPSTTSIIANPSSASSSSSAASSSSSFAFPPPSSSASPRAAWRGKLQYVGVRSMYPIGIRQPVRVWKVVVGDAAPPPPPPSAAGGGGGGGRGRRGRNKPVPEVSAERMRSLRSSTTKRRKTATATSTAGGGDWTVVEEAGKACRLVEVTDDAEKRRLGNGIFTGMQRFGGED